MGFIDLIGHISSGFGFVFGADHKARLLANKKKLAWEECYVFFYNEYQDSEIFNEFFEGLNRMPDEYFEDRELARPSGIEPTELCRAQISGFRTKTRNDDNKPVLVPSQKGTVTGRVWKPISQADYDLVQYFESIDSVWTTCEFVRVDERGNPTGEPETCRTFLYDKQHWHMTFKDFDLKRFKKETSLAEFDKDLDDMERKVAE